MTLMRPWKESNNLKWDMIKAEAENPQYEKYYSLEEHLATVTLPEVSMMLANTTDPTKVAEPPPGQNKSPQKQPEPGHILAQCFKNPQTNPDYVAVGPNCALRDIYNSMVQEAVELNRAFKGIKGMI